MRLHNVVLAVGLLPVLLAPTAGVAAGTIDWAKIKPYGLTLFYPGQASWEWILTDHSGNKTVRKGGACVECHETEETDMGKKMVAGKKLEPTPTPGKPPSVSLEVKFAQDSENLNAHLEWKDTGFHAGTKTDDKYPVKVALMLGSKTVKESVVSGCWGACHDDATGMASAAADDKRSLYLAASRNKLTRQGGGDDIKSADELNKLVGEGNFLEYWQARLIPGKPAEAASGYIFDKRHPADPSPLTAVGELKDGKWTVTLSRPLQGNGPGAISFGGGQKYYFGVALHDDYTKGRFHYISFGHNFSLDSGGEIVAAKQ